MVIDLAWKRILDCEYLFQRIVSYQDGVIHFLTPFVHLYNSIHSTSIGTAAFLTTVEYNQSILAQSHLDYNDMEQLTKLFKMLPHIREVIVVNAVAQGNVALLKHLDEIFGLNSIHQNLLDIAALYGQVRVLQYLNMINHNGCTKFAIEHAVESGHLHVIEWLLEYRDEGFRLRALEKAAEHGHVAILDCLSKYSRTMCISNFKTLTIAASRGHTQVLDWCAQNEKFISRSSLNLIRAIMSRDEENLDHLIACNMDIEVLEIAIKCGHVALAERMFGVSHSHVEISTIGEAAANGCLDIVQWYATKTAYQSFDTVLTMAMESMQSAIVLWLLENLAGSMVERTLMSLEKSQLISYSARWPRFQVIFERLRNTSVFIAARVGDFTTVRKLLADARVFSAMKENELIQCAMRHGNLKMVKYILDFLQSQHGGIDVDGILGGLSKEFGLHEHILDRILPLLSPMEITTMIHDCLELNFPNLVVSILEKRSMVWKRYRQYQYWFLICQRGYLEVARIVIQCGLIHHTIIYAMVTFNSLPILQYVLETTRPQSEVSVLVSAAKCGNLRVFQLARERFPSVCSSRIVDVAAVKGYLWILQDIDAIYPGCITSSAMTKAAEGNAINILEWLWDRSIRPCEETWQVACLYKRNEVLRWFESQGMNKCNEEMRLYSSLCKS